LEIRLVKDSDLDQVKKLWQYCFNDTPEFVEWFFANRFSPNNTLVLYEGNKVESALQLLPYKINLRDREMCTSYLVGVSTWPEARGRGYVTKLLKKATELMRERQQWVSVLLPFQYSFYRKYGWEVCYEFLLYQDCADWSPMQGSNHATIKPIDLEADLYLLGKSYSYFTRYYNGSMSRDKDDWARLWMDHVLDGGVGYILTEESGELGYVLFSIAGQNLHIRELIFTGYRAKRELLRFIGKHQGQVSTWSWRAPMDDMTYMEMLDPRKNLCKFPFAMGRIIDVEQALSNIPMNVDMEIVLEVTDPFIEWNNGRFRLSVDNGKLTVRKTMKSAESLLSIQTLNQLLWGTIHPRKAISEGKILCVKNDVLEKLNTIFPPVPVYLGEEF